MITIKKIINIVSKETAISVIDILSKSRKSEFVFSRQLIHYFSRKYTNKSTTVIAECTNRCNHATVLYSIKTIKNDITYDFRKKIILKKIDNELKKIDTSKDIVNFKTYTKITHFNNSILR